MTTLRSTPSIAARLRRSIAAQVLWLQEERMRLLGLADLRPAGATGRRVEASCRQAAQQARNAQSSFAMQPKAVVLKIDQLLSDVHTVSQVLIPHRIRYSTHTASISLPSPFHHHSLPPPLPSSPPHSLSLIPLSTVPFPFPPSFISALRTRLHYMGLMQKRRKDRARLIERQQAQQQQQLALLQAQARPRHAGVSSSSSSTAPQLSSLHRALLGLVRRKSAILQAYIAKRQTALVPVHRLGDEASSGRAATAAATTAATEWIICHSTTKRTALSRECRPREALQQGGDGGRSWLAITVEVKTVTLVTIAG